MWSLSLCFSYVTLDAKNTTQDEKNEKRPHTQVVRVEEKTKCNMSVSYLTNDQQP